MMNNILTPNASMSDSNWMRSAVRRMRTFDVFAGMLKVQDDLQVRTASGGTLSLIALLLIVTLVTTETASFLSLDRAQHLIVDPGRNEKLSIHFDLDFFNVNCEIIGVDALDTAGNAQLDVKNHMFKKRIDHEGRPIDGEVTRLDRIFRPLSGRVDGGKGHQPNASPSPSPISIPGKPGCGSCMGAQLTDDQCCNTCDEVRKAYEVRGWLIVDLNAIPHCAREGKSGLTDGSFNPAEGCNIHGFVEVIKVAGKIHIAPGHSFSFHGHTLHDISAIKDKKINLSHRINLLSFGPHVPGIHNPLDGAARMVSGEPDTFGQYQYHAQVVPTSYSRASGMVVETNQFSVTESFHKFDGVVVPGLFLYYNLSPIKVEVVEQRRSVFHFLVQLSAIIGGVFSMVSMLDAGLFHGAKALRKRAAGKLM
jgi:endoplasmic reticulum-Golgi intermediate compartment protein 3